EVGVGFGSRRHAVAGPPDTASPPVRHRSRTDEGVAGDGRLDYRRGPPTWTAPRLMTTRAAFPPMRYPRWRYEETPRITRSANFPGSKLPTSSPNPIACAALIFA